MADAAGGSRRSSPGDGVARSYADILDAVEAARRQAHGEAEVAIEEAEAQLDRELRRFDRVAAALGGTGSGAVTEAKAPARSSKRKPRGRRGRRASATPAAILERREAIHRHLEEHPRPLSLGEVCRALNLTPASTGSALKHLCEVGRVVRIGVGSATRYQVGAAPAAPSGTLEGQILAVLQDRASATLDELVLATHAPRDEVVKACGALVREEEIQMGRRDGRAVYVSRSSS